MSDTDLKNYQSQLQQVSTFLNYYLKLVYILYEDAVFEPYKASGYSINESIYCRIYVVAVTASGCSHTYLNSI